jgi:hypothetical protein
MSNLFEVRYQFERVRQQALSRARGEGPEPSADDVVLLKALRGEIPVFWKAASAKDIWAAIRLSEEFGLTRSVVIETQQADLAARELVAAKMPAIVGPLGDPRYREPTRRRRRGVDDEATGGRLSATHFPWEPAPALAPIEELDHDHDHDHDVHPCMVGCTEDHVHINCDNPLHHHDETYPTCYGHNCCATGVALPQEEHDPIVGNSGLWNKGVEYAFGAALTTSGATLIDYARIAVRNGMPRDQAIASLTLNPARIMGISDRVGSLEPGKDADLLIFNSDPLSPASRLVLVMVNGRTVGGTEQLWDGLNKELAK